MTLTQTHHFYVRKVYCLITLICPIMLISHIAQLLLIRTFYCFRKGPHISFKYARHTLPDDGRSISRNVAHLNMLVHYVVNTEQTSKNIFTYIHF